MSIPAWDKWAAATYLFTIGLAVGFVSGYSLGILQGSSNAVFILLFPAIAIAVMFVALFMMARRIGRKG